MRPSTSKSRRLRGKKSISKSKKPRRNWLDLPSDVIANILHRVGAIDILENVQKVCTAWRKICKDQAMWRVIDMQQNYGCLSAFPFNPVKMCMHSVDLSEGQLVDINIDSFCSDELLEYIADRPNHLKRLEISYSYGTIDESLTVALKKLPLLEELCLSFTYMSEESLEVAGKCCPMLKSLKYNDHYHDLDNKDEEMILIYNQHVEAIVKHLPHLRHLELIGNGMNNVGLRTILDRCPHLESLDLRGCLNLRLDGDLGKRCSQQIRSLRLPHDPFESSRSAAIDISFDDPFTGSDYAWW